MQIQRVLVPVDLNKGYRAMAPVTRRMFDRRNFEIVILHVIEEQLRSLRGNEVERAMSQMEFLARKEFGTAHVRRRVERGRAADCIIDYARTHAVDVIVMPAGGLTSLRRGQLGHVSEDVLLGAQCAVWMEWMSGSVEHVRQICCPVRLDDTGLDGARFDESNAAVLQRAGELARDLEASVTMVCALSAHPRKAAEFIWNPALREREIRLARARVEALRDQYVPSAEVHIQVGDVSSVVSQVLHRMNSGLLVAAGQGEAKLAAEMDCPVLRIARPMATAPAIAQAAGRLA